MSKHWYNNGTRQMLVEECPEGFTLGKLPMSDETKKKLSLAHKGKTPHNKGVPCSLDTKKKITNSLKLRWEEGIYSNRKKRPPTTQETIEKIKASRGEYHHSEATKQKIGNSNRGKPKRKLSESEQKKRQEAIYKTHKRNNSFNISSDEMRYYEYLKNLYGEDNVIHQYFDKERYPFHCDFYIKSEDLFIELNLHWTHGGMPFNEENPECVAQLKSWEDKAKNSDFYKRAILTWTDLDVRKIKTAKNSGINYKMFYHKEELLNESIAT